MGKKMTAAEAKKIVQAFEATSSLTKAGAQFGLGKVDFRDKYREARKLLGLPDIPSSVEMTPDAASQFLATVAAYDTQRLAARGLGLSQSRISTLVAEARKVLGMTPSVAPTGPSAEVAGPVDTSDLLSGAASESDVLRARLRSLEATVKSYREQALDAQVIRNEIFKIAHSKPQIPTWLARPAKRGAHTLGVPFLFASDWHWGEVVQASEIGGVNSYNLEIAQKRCHTLIENTIDILTNHMVNPNYPGIVFALGGDMVSGNIHEELCETNDMPIMPVVLDIVDHLIAAIKRLKKVFGKVFVPCVAGNHSRIHKKIRAKESNYSSFDWLIYQCLDRYFADDDDVIFYIPDGPDALISVYGHRYLITHGNQFRGGDGMIGPLGPITRGDHKKRSRNAQIDQEYDTLVIGHFHQLLMMRRIIMNGSLIGYNEFAHSNNFGFENPQQALWLTHPERGITFSMPIHVGEKQVAKNDSPWISFFDAKKAA